MLHVAKAILRLQLCGLRACEPGSCHGNRHGRMLAGLHGLGACAGSPAAKLLLLERGWLGTSLYSSGGERPPFR